MRHWRRILALLELSPAGQTLATHARDLAHLHGAQLMLGTIVPHRPGWETSEAEWLTPQQATAALEAIFLQRLRHLAARLGADAAQLFARGGAMSACVRDLIATCEPDLVLVSRAAPFGLHVAADNEAFDLLVVHAPPRKTVLGRLVRALALAG